MANQNTDIAKPTQPIDSSKYIRTFAKDMAMLAGKKSLVGIGGEEQASKSLSGAFPSQSTSQDFKYPTTAPVKKHHGFSFLKRETKKVSPPEEIPQTAVEKKLSDISILANQVEKPDLNEEIKGDLEGYLTQVPDTVQKVPTTIPMIVPPPQSIPVIPVVASIPAPQATPNSPTTSERENILARLRAKAKPQEKVSIDNFALPELEAPVEEMLLEAPITPPVSIPVDTPLPPNPVRLEFAPPIIQTFLNTPHSAPPTSTIPEVPTSPPPIPVALPARSNALPVSSQPTREWALPIPKGAIQSVAESQPIPAFKPIVPTAPVNKPVIEPIPMPAKTAPAPFGLIPEAPEPNQSTTPLHTFSSDLSSRIDTQRASQFSVLAADQDAHVVTTAPKRSRNIWIPIIVGVLLIVIGLGGAYLTYTVVSGRAPVALSLSPSSLIVPDKQVQLSGSGQTLWQALADETQVPLGQNKILLTYVSEATTTRQGTVQIPASGGAFLNALNLPAPDILLRNINPESTVGIVHAGTETRPFFILRVTSYERTFAGMLDWEATMPSDLSEFYPPYPITNLGTSSSTSPSLNRVGFIDELVSNHNARAYQDANGRTILIYGYADQQTLIIARNEAAFTLLLQRLQANGQ